MQERIKALKTKDKHPTFNVTGLMELADKVTERSDRGQTGLTKFSLEQQLSLTEVDQTCIGKARSVVGIIKVYKRQL